MRVGIEVRRPLFCYFFFLFLSLREGGGGLWRVGFRERGKRESEGGELGRRCLGKGWFRERQ